MLSGNADFPRQSKGVGHLILFIKCFLGIFVLMGIAFSLYALMQLWKTSNFVKTSTGQARATFVGYDEEWFRTTSSSPSPTNWGQQDFTETESVMIYPVFKYVTTDGQTVQVRESKAHIFEMFNPGQEVEILLSPHAEPRLAGFYALYLRDLVILALGFCFIAIPLLIGRVVIPSLESRASVQMAAHFQSVAAEIAATRVGPISVPALLKGIAVFFGFVIVISIVAGAVPFLEQLGIGVGSKLITALEEQRYDEARELILKRKGINRVDAYNRNALLNGKTALVEMIRERGGTFTVNAAAASR